MSAVGAKRPIWAQLRALREAVLAAAPGRSATVDWTRPAPEVREGAVSDPEPTSNPQSEWQVSLNKRSLKMEE